MSDVDVIVLLCSFCLCGMSVFVSYVWMCWLVLFGVCFPTCVVLFVFVFCLHWFVGNGMCLFDVRFLMFCLCVSAICLLCYCCCVLVSCVLCCAFLILYVVGFRVVCVVCLCVLLMFGFCWFVCVLCLSQCMCFVRVCYSRYFAMCCW